MLSPHARHCHCRPHSHGSCPLQRKQPYDRSAHWFFQTEASLHLWTPEIYGSFSRVFTVVRQVSAAEIDNLRKPRHLRPYLHFDFEVETQLRELGWGWNFFKRSSKPAELRVQTDSGHQLPTDKIRFCVTCCAENINWPKYQTRDLQAEAEQEVRGPRLHPPPPQLPINTRS